MKILHLAESGAFVMGRTILKKKKAVVAGWFVKWGYYCIKARKCVTEEIPYHAYLVRTVCL